MRPWAPGGDRRCNHVQRLGHNRQTDDELAAPARAVAVDVHRPAVHLHERLHQRQTDAQPVTRSLQRRIELREHVEDPGDVFPRDADAVVPHFEYRLTVLRLDRQDDMPALIGKLRGVAQEVADHLSQPHRIGIEIQRLRRHRDDQLVVQTAVQRARGLGSLVDDRRQLDTLEAKLDPAPGNAAHVEQVIHQPGHLIDLPLEHLGR